jgi:hypothetical protein
MISFSVKVEVKHEQVIEFLSTGISTEMSEKYRILLAE